MEQSGLLDDNFKDRDTLLIQEANINPFNKEVRPKINTESDKSSGLEFELTDKNHLSYSGRSGRTIGSIPDLTQS